MAKVSSSTASSPDALIGLQNQQSDVLRRQKHNAKLQSDSRSDVLNMLPVKGKKPRWAPEEAEEGNEDGGNNLRESINKARKNKKPKKEGKISQTSNSISSGTSKFLVDMWLAAPETFGISILYVNIHVFCGLVLGHDLFCKLGHEWAGMVPEAKVVLDRLDTGNGPVSQNMDDIGKVEGIIVIIVDLIALFIILLAYLMMMLPVLIAQGLLDKVFDAATYVFK